MRYLFVLCSLLVTTPVYAKLNVVTTTQDLASIAEAVGGDYVKVTSLTRGSQDPHYIEPKPSYARVLNRADLLIHVGLDLEIGWLPVLLTQSRNSSIQPGQSGNLDASEGIQIREVPAGSVDRSMGDIHPLGNPHYWLDPRNGLLIAQAIAARLMSLDPENRQYYEQHRDHFQSRLRDKISHWKQQLTAKRGERLVTYHKTFSYFVAWADLKVVDFVEPKPGIPPNPAHILQLIDRIPREKVQLILMANFNNPKPAEEVARRTGVPLLIVPSSVGGATAAETYSELFDYIVKKILESQ